jgi:hypothetical protein
VLLSTRAIALFLIIPLVFWSLRIHLTRGTAFGVTLVTTFLATWLPFWVWGGETFWKAGPFAVQGGYLPAVALVLLGGLNIFVGSRVQTVRGLMGSISVLLFIAVTSRLVMRLVTIGWEEAVYGNGFDFAYYAMALPPALLALTLFASPDSHDTNGQSTHKDGNRHEHSNSATDRGERSNSSAGDRDDLRELFTRGGAHSHEKGEGGILR